jgi:hypothetical protein
MSVHGHEQYVPGQGVNLIVFALYHDTTYLVFARGAPIDHLNPVIAM